jgi:hypothetical protein
MQHGSCTTRRVHRRPRGHPLLPEDARTPAHAFTVDARLPRGRHGGVRRRHHRRARVSGDPLDRNPRVVDRRADARQRRARLVVHERKDRVRHGARRRARRASGARRDEARGPECRGRRLHQLRARRRARRPGPGRRRRPRDAQLAERTGQPPLRRARTRHLPRAVLGAGGVRPHARGVYALRTIHGARRRASGHTAGARSRPPRAATAAPAAGDRARPEPRLVDPAARQRAPPVACAARAPALDA